MDVNGTRFHLILGREEWASAPVQTELDWDSERAGLRLRPRLFRFPAPPGDRQPRPEDRRGAGRDRYGNWYWIAENGREIRFLTADGRQSEHFWSDADLATACADEPAGVFQPLLAPVPRVLHLSGLAVTTEHRLVVGVLAAEDAPAGLLFFDLHGGGPPDLRPWPAEVPFAPFDLAPAPAGGVWILDRDLADPAGVARLWQLDRLLQVVAIDGTLVELAPAQEDDFQPVAAQPADLPRRRARRTFPSGIVLELAASLEPIQAIAIEALPDGTLLVLQSDPAQASSWVYRYRGAQQLGRRELRIMVDQEADLAMTEALPLRGHDLAFLPDTAQPAEGVAGTLYVADGGGNQSFAWSFLDQGAAFDLELQPRYLPMRLFSGKALVGDGQAVFYDLQERWLPLTEQPQRRYVPEGQWDGPLFDGKQPDCVWHRLFLDACIPPGAEIAVESRAANNVALLGYMPWSNEPRLYRRSGGAELPGYQPFTADELRQPGAGTWELLFQRAEGRYLQLRLTLRGTGRNTPRLRALRAYYPRFSYLKEYLPAVYQQDDISASFLDRFLANMEGLYTALEDRIAQAHTLFDVRTTADEYLDWLAGWFGMLLDPGWDAPRRRLFLRHAMELFSQRGTPAGLVRAIRLALDPCPDDRLLSEDVLGSPAESDRRVLRYTVRVVERFLTRSHPGVLFGDPTDTIGPGLFTTGSAWTPEQGAEPLHQRFREELERSYGAIEQLNAAWNTSYSNFEAILFSPVVPANPAAANDWRAFTRGPIGFTYADVSAADEQVYQAFLARRYREIATLTQAYQLAPESAPASFDKLQLPGETDLPTGGRRLFDWAQFVSLVLPIKRSAHHFTVLVPTDPSESQASRARRLETAWRVANLEKPAHTSFDVKHYWALFRIGEARLGLDTLLDEGNRFVALVLDHGYLGASYLAPSQPWNLRNRIVVGRGPMGVAAL